MISLLELFEVEHSRIMPEGKNFAKTISDSEECKKLIKKVVNADIEIPDEKSGIYYIARGRINHSIINYYLGMVLSGFKGTYAKMGNTIGGNAFASERLWRLTSLYHDIGYFQTDIKNGDLIYKDKFKYYLFSDSNYFNKDVGYAFFDNFSQIYGDLFSYSYEEIESYDRWDRERRKENAMEAKRKMDSLISDDEFVKLEKTCEELLNHGIYGGAYLYNRLMRKAMSHYILSDFLYIKASCMGIAQHNIFKSSSKEEDLKIPKELEKLKSTSDFKIDEKNPLLLFLSLIDTLECVKKFSASSNGPTFFQTDTVLKNIHMKIDDNCINADCSNLYERIMDKEEYKRNLLLNTYQSYMKNVESLSDWTTYLVKADEKTDEGIPLSFSIS